MDGIKSINKWFLHTKTLDTVQLYHLMGKMDIIKQLPGLMYGTFVDVTYGMGIIGPVIHALLLIYSLHGTTDKLPSFNYLYARYIKLLMKINNWSIFHTNFCILEAHCD